MLFVGRQRFPVAYLPLCHLSYGQVKVRYMALRYVALWQKVGKEINQSLQGLGTPNLHWGRNTTGQLEESWFWSLASYCKRVTAILSCEVRRH